MKKTLLLTFVLISFLVPHQAKATHAAGGEIYYEHVAGNTYRVFVFLYRDVAGSDMPGTIDLCITSSCDAPRTVILGQVPDPLSGNASGSSVSNLNECALPNPGATGGVDYQLYVYSDLVTLNGPCPDWLFSYTLCCRNHAIVNLVSPGNTAIYLEAKLNNTIGPNTSPKFIVPAVKRWCTVDPTDSASKPVVWSQASIEPDGDSIFYKFANPQTGGGCSSTAAGPTNINFAGGYSLTSPMTTHNGITIDRKNGTFTFMPVLPEVVVIRIDIEEYRFNTNGSLRWELVGSSMRDIQVAISAICVNTVADGDKLNFPAGSGLGKDSTMAKDSLRNILGNYGIAAANELDSASTSPNDTFVKIQVLQNYTCNDASVNLPFKAPLVCSSVHPTDFRILGPDGIARPVYEVETNCQVDLTTTEVKLKLYQSFDVNGLYVLYIKRGNDGNTLTNRCGFEIKDNIVYLIEVKDCPILDYEIENVTTLEDQHIKIEFNLDPTSYYSNTFNQISVLRANNDLNFYKVGEVKDQNIRSFVDTTLTSIDVDNQIYQYLLQLYTNGNPRVPTNYINSIVLRGDSLGGNNIAFHWNPYLNDTYGGATHYEFFEGVYDSTLLDWTWTSIQKVGGALDYSYAVPENRPGQFWYKVEASDPAFINTRISESNYLTLGVPPPPPGLTPVVNYIPNVITPNGDAQNDRFYFQFLLNNPNTRPYSNLSLSIFNRWGKQVFHDDNFMASNTAEAGWDGTDQQSGQKVADGVYFYVARFTDPGTGKSEQLNGSVTVSGQR